MPFPAADLYPGPPAFPGTPRARFLTPTQDVPFRIEGGLFGSLPRGLDVWRDVAGAWHTTAMTSAENRETAGRFYGGGRVHTITDEQAAELRAAGFADHILEEDS